MLMDLIGAFFCEVATDEERSYVSGRMDAKSGMVICYPECFMTTLACRLQSINHLLINDRKFAHRNFQIYE
jgi:hypothetical protein